MANRLTKSKMHSEKEYGDYPLARQSTKYVRAKMKSGRRSEECTCQRLSLEVVLGAPFSTQSGATEIVRLPKALRRQLIVSLDTLLAQGSPFSFFVFHIVQVERLETHGKMRYLHPNPGFMRQLEDKVQPALRKGDHLLTQGDGSAILFLPGVEQRGAYSILERIYTQVDLLEAETVIPPLKDETHILIGGSSYPAQGETCERLLQQAERCARRVSLRPRIMTRATTSVAYSTQQTSPRHVDVSVEGNSFSATPFLHLPATLPRRLTSFIPHSLAQELRCVPVGKDQRVLTVAMANPQNREHIDYLTQLTRMKIFPVACAQEELDMLLATKW